MIENKVSVIMITYGHEEFIAEAISGVLMQECNFEIELIIADDCSPDNTEQVVKSFEDHPKYNWIKYTKHKFNKGMMPNFIYALEQCNGKYIALCEGDDYWTDPLKLQKQVDFLEKDNDYIICFHKASIMENNTIKENWITKIPLKDFTTVNDLISLGNYIMTPTVMFRNILDKMPKAFEFSPVGDYFLYILLMQNGGKIKFINEDMAIYRFGSGVHSTSTNKSKVWDWYLVLTLIYMCVNENLKDQLNKKIEEAKFNILYNQLKNTSIKILANILYQRLSSLFSFKKSFKIIYKLKSII